MVFGAELLFTRLFTTSKEEARGGARAPFLFFFQAAPRSDASQLNLNHLQLMCHLRRVCGDGCAASGGEAAAGLQVSEASFGPWGRGGASAPNPQSQFPSRRKDTIV